MRQVLGPHTYTSYEVLIGDYWFAIDTSLPLLPQVVGMTAYRLRRGEKIVKITP